MQPDWARSLRDQCSDASVPFLFKQWGEWAPYDSDRAGQYELKSFCAGPPEPYAMQRVGKNLAGNLLDDSSHHQFPSIKSIPSI